MTCCNICGKPKLSSDLPVSIELWKTCDCEPPELAASPAERPTENYPSEPKEFLDHVLYCPDGSWLAFFVDGTRRVMTPLERHLWLRVTSPAEGPKPRPRCPKCGSEGIFTSIRTDQFPHGLEVKCADCKQVLPIRDIADFAQFFPARAKGDAK